MATPYATPDTCICKWDGDDHYGSLVEVHPNCPKHAKFPDCQHIYMLSFTRIKGHTTGRCMRCGDVRRVSPEELREGQDDQRIRAH